MTPPPEEVPVRVEEFEVAGIRVLLRRQEGHAVVALRLYLRGGASTLPPEHGGLDALLGRVARRGTASFPKERLNAELARLGADLGSGAGEDYDVYHLRCLRRDFDDAWAVFAEVVRAPRLEPDEIELVRHQMLLGIRQRHDSPDGRLGELARETVYAGHPYATHPAGTEDSVRQLERDHLVDRARALLHRDRLLLVAVGDLTRDTLEARVRAALGDLDAAPDPLPEIPPLRFDTARLVVEARDLPTNYIMGQFTAPALADPEHPATLLAMSILRDRFFEEVRTKRNLSYAPSAGLGQNAANLGWIYVTAVDPKTTLEVMRAEMRKLRDVALDPKDLRDKVEVYITRYYLQNESNQAQAMFLAGHELLGRGWRHGLDFVPRLEALEPEDVRRAAQCLHHLQYTYLGNPDLADRDTFVDP